MSQASSELPNTHNFNPYRNGSSALVSKFMSRRRRAEVNSITSACALRRYLQLHRTLNVGILTTPTVTPLPNGTTSGEHAFRLIVRWSKFLQLRTLWTGMIGSSMAKRQWQLVGFLNRFKSSPVTAPNHLTDHRMKVSRTNLKP